MTTAKGEPVQKGMGAYKLTCLLAGPLTALAVILFCDLQPGKPEVTAMAAVALWMAIWWITEAIPLAATSLLPLVLFPALGIMDGKTTSVQYVNYIIFLFVGGFMVALAMERWQLHQRIALHILVRLGSRLRGILMGFMVASAFLSMWISNTATAMMMVPIGLALLSKLGKSMAAQDVARYAVAIFLGIAYSASLGGVATLVGTPPNLIFLKTFSEFFPMAEEISFARWMVFALPFAASFLVLVWAILVRWYLPKDDGQTMGKASFREQLQRLGPMSYEEKAVAVVFTLLALLWLSRADLRLGAFTVPGWSNLFANPGYFNDGTVSIAMALILFLIPSKAQPGKAVMDWETAQKLPWGVVLLFGGGFALAKGFAGSGLSQWFAENLSGASHWPVLLMVLLICFIITFLTELTSNTATAQIFLPLIATLAVTAQIHPLLVMIPATLACSFAFMLPVATPPNAIVFGSGMLKVSQMSRTGLWLNLIAIIAVAIYIYFAAGPLLGLDLRQFPDWAR